MSTNVTVVENDQVRRALYLGNMVGGLVIGEKRNPADVANVLQVINDHSDFASRLGAGPILDSSKIREELILWQKFDQKFFPDVNVGNYTALRIPGMVSGFNWSIVNARGVSANQFVERMRKEYKIWTYSDDLNAIRSDRNAVSMSYVVLVRDRIAADEELKNKSAEILAEEAIPAITLPENLRLDAFHWWKTGRHLDPETWTLDAGSRDADGYVPNVSWSAVNGRLYVGWYGPRNASGTLRARAVVS